MNSEAECKSDVEDHSSFHVSRVIHEEGTIEEFPSLTEVQDDRETPSMSSQTVTVLGMLNNVHFILKGLS